VFAIGGIDLDRLPELRSSGVSRVCAIRSLAEAADPEDQVRRFREALA
jgi:thiamine-phosphate pyrophosphorylase